MRQEVVDRQERVGVLLVAGTVSTVEAEGQSIENGISSLALDLIGQPGSRVHASFFCVHISTQVVLEKVVGESIVLGVEERQIGQVLAGGEQLAAVIVHEVSEAQDLPPVDAQVRHSGSPVVAGVPDGHIIVGQHLGVGRGGLMSIHIPDVVSIAGRV